MLALIIDIAIIVLAVKAIMTAVTGIKEFFKD